MNNIQIVYIPVKEHSEFKILKDGIGLENCYPQEGFFYTEEQLKPLQELVDEGYNAYDTSHHLQVQRWLKTIENFLNKES